jgi:hypothetical protein
MGEVNRPSWAGLHAFSSIRVTCEGIGTAASLASLSVPPSWPMTGLQTNPGSPVLADESVEGDHGPHEKPRGVAFGDGLIAMMTGRRGIDRDDNDPGAATRRRESPDAPR